VLVFENVSIGDTGTYCCVADLEEDCAELIVLEQGIDAL